ncbi:MFS transporter [Rhodanobacter sp. Si-c]|uniref:MFS transporter n=1 Tax=Rhodanobacter lycopersici TaxID=3162487 RepID=A0ABV3QD30_9GAMM
MPRNVRLLIGTRAARSFGQGAMVAAFALYLHALGWAGTTIGAVLMGALLAGSVLTLVVGPLSDRGHRRRFLLGYELLQVAVALVAMATTLPWLLTVAAVMGGFGRGANGAAGPFSPVEQAWLSHELPMARRGRVFSFNTAVGFFGMAGGALLAALPPWLSGHAMTPGDYRLLFALPLLGSLVSLGLLLATREIALPASVPDPAAQLTVRRRENGLLLRLVLVNALNGFGVGMVGPLVAYWFALKFHHGLAEIGPGMALGFLLGAAGSLLAGRLAVRAGVVRSVVLMRATGIVLLLLMPLAPWFWLAMLLYALRGAFNRGTAGVRQALATGLTGDSRRGLASSLQSISMQVPRAAGPVLAGALFHAGYLSLPFVIGAAFQCAYVVLYARFFGAHEAARAETG